MELVLDDRANLCLSGGAKGADMQWGVCAGLAGHGVIHFSFAGHRTLAPDQEVVRLTEAQLDEATPHVRRAAKGLRKNPPYKSWVRDLIHRNWFQVAATERVYAVSSIVDGLVQGGTAWAVQMFIDRMEDEGTGTDDRLHCFDQVADRWFSRIGGVWVDAGTPAKPYGVYTGIGTRELLPNGKRAIRAIMGVERMFNSPPM